MKHISTNPHIKKEKSYSQFSTPNPKSGGKNNTYDVNLLFESAALRSFT